MSSSLDVNLESSLQPPLGGSSNALLTPKSAAGGGGGNASSSTASVAPAAPMSPVTNPLALPSHHSNTEHLSLPSLGAGHSQNEIGRRTSNLSASSTSLEATARSTGGGGGVGGASSMRSHSTNSSRENTVGPGASHHGGPGGSRAVSQLGGSLNQLASSTRNSVEKSHHHSTVSITWRARRGSSSDEEDVSDDAITASSPAKVSLSQQSLVQRHCCDAFLRLIRPPKRSQALESSSLFLMSGTNPFRVFFFNVQRHKIFEGFIILNILANCVFLALDDPTTSKTPMFQRVAEYWFTAVFTLEMVIKVIGMGFVLHKGAYLRNSWNIIDFCIVILSYLSFSDSIGNYSALRTVRVLRPLRSMNQVRELQIIVLGLLHSLTGLVHVVILLFFVFAIFGILGVQLWKGLYRMRCVEFTTSVENVTSLETNITTLQNVTREVVTDMFCAQGADSSGWNGFRCPGDLSCLPRQNPYQGYLNFDNVGSAILLLFTLMTFEDWTSQLQIVFDTFGQYGIIYFICFIIMGSYFISNLALAVINEKFVEAHARAILEEEKEKEAAAVDARMSIAENMNLKEDIGSVPQGHIRSFDADMEGMVVGDGDETPISSLPPQRRRASSVGARDVETIEIPELPPRDDDAGEVAAAPPPHSTGDTRAEHAGDDGLTPLQTVPDAPAPTVWERIEDIRKAVHFMTEGYARPHPDATSADLETYRETAATTLFIKIIVLCILINTVLLASQHFQQPDWLDNIQTYGNYSMIGIFAIEFLLKHIGMGLKNYWREPFNFLDGGIVISSFVELGLAGSSTVSVFRALRLLRVLKLLKNFPSLRKIIRVMLNAFRNTGYLNLIMLLYIFIAALLGMQLFGGAMRANETPEDPVRSTFDNFYWASLTVFQILTRDNWFSIMITASVNTSPAAIIFFVGCVLVGDFLILNLFLAILIGAFEEDNETDEVDVFESSLSSISIDASMSRKKKHQNIKDKRMLFLGNVHPDEVIHIGAPMAAQMRRAKMLKRATSMVGFKQAVVLHGAMPSFDVRGGGSPLIELGDTAFRLGAPHGGGIIESGGDSATNALTLDVDPQGTPTTFVARNAVLAESVNVDESQDASSASGVDGATGAAANRASPMADKSGPFHFPLTTDDNELNGLKFDRIAGFDDAAAPAATKQHTDQFDGTAAVVDDGEDERPFVAMPYCPKCGTDMQAPLQEPPLIAKITPEVLHERMCKIIQVRKSKEKVLEELLAYVARQMQAREAATIPKLETLVGQAWACGLLLSSTVDEFIRAEKPWECVQEALIDEQLVLDLRVGEEQVGRSLVAYANANVPEEHETNGGSSLFLFGPKNKFRLIVSEIVALPIFDQVILLCILISSLLLAVDNPRDDQTSTLYTVLNVFDIVFTIIFSLEMCMKIIALGFVFHSSAYLRDPWNILDGFIVAVSILSLSISSINIGFLKVLRTLRALRPLRVITRNRGLKIVVMTLIESIKGIANVALIALLNYLIFGILGVQFFGGRMYECSDPLITKRVECIGVTTNQFGELVDRKWLPLRRNYDNLGNAMLSLFEISTMEWWIDALYEGIDAVSYDEVGIRDYQPVYGLFFVAFVVVASFFMLNMFVGVVISNFNNVKSHMDGVSLLTDEQKMWVETQRLMLNFKPGVKVRHRKTAAAKFTAYIIEREAFEFLIAACIFLNVLVLGMDYHGSSEAYDFTLQTVNDIFSLVFLIEAAMKIFAFGWMYFIDGWNRFDFFLVLVSIVGFVLRVSPATVSGNIAALQVFRVFRIMRVLRLVKSAKHVRILLESLWYSLPSLGNICLFLALLFFMYAVLGVQLFNAVNSGVRMDNKQTNFHNFWNALIVLFKCMTVTDWNMFMHDTMATPPRCIDKGPNANCGNAFAPVYFVTFMLLAPFVLTNLLVAVVLENFSTATQLEKSQVRMSDLHKFVEIWADYDQEATMTMPTTKFSSLLARLRPPLGIPRSKSRLEILKQSRTYRLPEHGGYIHFVETLIPLARQSIGIQLTVREIREHEQQWRINFPSLQELPILRYRNSPVTVDQFFSATFIQAAFRRRVAMKKADRLRAERQRAIERFYDVQNRALVSNAVARRSLTRWSVSGGGSALSALSPAPLGAIGQQQHQQQQLARPASASPPSAQRASVSDNEVSTMSLGASLVPPSPSATPSQQQQQQSPQRPPSAARTHLTATIVTGANGPTSAAGGASSSASATASPKERPLSRETGPHASLLRQFGSGVALKDGHASQLPPS